MLKGLICEKIIKIINSYLVFSIFIDNVSVISCIQLTLSPGAGGGGGGGG